MKARRTVTAATAAVLCGISVVVLTGTTTAGREHTDVDLRLCGPEADSTFRIGEVDLMEPLGRWPSAETIADDSLRLSLGQRFSLLDSAGQIGSDITIRRLQSCRAGTVDVVFYHVRGTAGDRDDNVYIAIDAGQGPASSYLLATLQSDCQGTFLRGSFLADDGRLRVEALRHDFDCEADTLVGTERYPASVVTIRSDGTLRVDDADAQPTEGSPEEDLDEDSNGM